jgi:hypothetical protein
MIISKKKKRFHDLNIFLNEKKSPTRNEKKMYVCKDW